MKTNTDKTNPHAKSISFDSHTNPVLTFIRGECTAYFLRHAASPSWCIPGHCQSQTLTTLSDPFARFL